MRFGANDDRWWRGCAGCATSSARCWAPALRDAGACRSSPLIAALRWATRCTSATSPARRCSCALSPHLARAVGRRQRWQALAVHRRQRPVLPQRRDGDGQGDGRSGGRDRALEAGDGDVRATAPSSASGSSALASAGSPRPWRCRRACTSLASGPRTPTRTWATARSSKRSGWAASPWRLRRRWRASSARAAWATRSATPGDARDHVGAHPSGPFRRSRSRRPAGMDVRRVVETGVAPIINTGIAHRRAGVGSGRRGRRARAARLLRAGALAFASHA